MNFISNYPPALTMTQKKLEEKAKETAKGISKGSKTWKKPKITRHGNMRQLTQTSPA